MIDTRVIGIDAAHPDPAVIDRAVGIIRSGGIIVAPTETRYGLLARADSREGLKRLYRLKDRPSSMPTAIFASGPDDLKRYGETNAISELLADAFLPGPLTLVLTAAVSWPAPVVMSGKIGIRISSAPLITRLIGQCPFPVSATSANRSGRSESARIDQIIEIFPAGVELYLDAGPLSHPVSTVVDCSSGEARILREGAISREEIAAVIRKVKC